ncbi:hypothetical protein TU81_03950 [Pseudomonas lini]|nr:hypothetical protein TU81_03950 [Pseudomonas lini]KNH44809.1 hypothetical protein ACS73_18980 [Pseudomonas lini]
MSGLKADNLYWGSFQSAQHAVEGWFAQLERRALYRGAFASVADLKAVTNQFIEAHNEHSAKPFT